MSSGHALVRSKCLVSSCMLNFYCMNPTLCNGGSGNIKLNRKPQLHNHLMSILHQNRSFESIQYSSVQFSSFQSRSRVWLFATQWMAARQASLSITNSRSLLKLTSIESVVPSSHLILCCPLFPLPPIPPSIRDFSNESTLRIRWPEYWSLKVLG